MDGHGDTVPRNENEVIGFIEQVFSDVDGDKWSDLESSIGKIDFENYLSDFEKTKKMIIYLIKCTLLNHLQLI
ncbi:hypothetical protein DSECCO2_255300 [anaerobic digester metagenome]